MAARLRERAAARDAGPEGPALREPDGAGFREPDGAALREQGEQGWSPAPSGAGELPVHEVTGDLTALLDIWDHAHEVWIVDAISSGRPAGTIVEIDLLAPGAPALDASTLRSSHALGVAEVLALGRQLGRLPSRLIAFGIEGADFALGRPLGPAVARAADELAREILRRTAREA